MHAARSIPAHRYSFISLALAVVFSQGAAWSFAASPPTGTEGASTVYPISIGPTIIDESEILLRSDGAAFAYYGSSISISGDTIVVGAMGAYNDGGGSGSAYVFVRRASGWGAARYETAKLLPSDGAALDRFGTSVSVSGDTVVVTAPFDDDNGSESGSAYVFVKPAGGWAGILTEDAKLLPSDGSWLARFGTSVSISRDTVVVGAFNDWDNGSGSGSAYVFVKPVGGWNGILNEEAKLLPTDGALSAHFGVSVSISGDSVAVGAFQDRNDGIPSGSAYVFIKPVGGWLGILNEEAKLLASDGARSDLFGLSVGISGETVVVGARGDDDNGSTSGSAYIFVKPTGGWSGRLNETTKLLPSDNRVSDDFGASVSVSGNTVVVGAVGGSRNIYSTGAAYTFTKASGGWAETAKETTKLLPSDGESTAQFGSAVSVAGDIVVVASKTKDDDTGRDSGSAYVFQLAPPDVLGLLNDLITIGLDHGIENSLHVKLDAVVIMLTDSAEGNDRASIPLLDAFLKQVEAQRGKEIAEADADELITRTLEIVDLLGEK